MSEWERWNFLLRKSGTAIFAALCRFTLAGYRKIRSGSNAEAVDCRQANSKGQIGWSTAWAICLAGRFHDGATAQKNIQLLIDKALFRNLFNVHWPAIFQIDGNFGYVAGVNECLIGYQDGVIELLPALPPDWREGKMNGAQIRGARIGFSWKNGQVTQVSSDREIILSGKNLAKNCRIGELIRLKEGT